MVGVAVVTLADAGSNATAPVWAYGVPLLGMLSLVGATFVERRDPGTVPPLTALAVHCATSAVVFTAIAVVTGDAVVPGDASFWVATAWLVVLPTFGGYGLYWVLLRRIDVARVNTLMFLMAPVTAVWGALAFGESFTVTTAIGMAVGVVAVIVVSAGRAPSRDGVAPGSTTPQQGRPRPGAPEGPREEHRLEEQADQAPGVGVEPERIPVVDVLGDVPGEHRDEERGDDPAHQHRVAVQQEQPDAEHDLDDARRDHDESGVERDPAGDLRVELVAREREMRGPGEDQETAEDTAERAAQPGHHHSRRSPTVLTR
jgi:hypothetical protein